MSTAYYQEVGLDALARHHWTWISESFVHVLILREWGEQTLSARIDEQYLREVPRAFRTIGIMLESDFRITLGSEGQPYAQQLPDPGRSAVEMRERELSLIQGFEPELKELANRFARGGLDDAAALAKEALSSRREYVHWLSDQQNTLTEATERKCRAPENVEAKTIWRTLNRLLAHLLATIDETTVHMLVLRHHNQLDEAGRFWQDSYAYMLLATDLIRLFARREWALDLRDESISGDVEPPRIAATSSEIRERNLERHKVLKDVAESAALKTATQPSTRSDPEVVALSRAIAERVARAPGSTKPTDPRFETMLGRHRYPPE